MQKIFDCHSHWGTAKGHIFRTTEELARQEKIWKTKGRNWAEGEMMDYMRTNGVRVILDLSFHKMLPIGQIREYHDYACLYYYAARETVARQLANAGLRLINVIDHQGHAMAAGDDESGSPNFMYIAARV